MWLSLVFTCVQILDTLNLLNKEFSHVNAGLEQSRYNIAAKSGSTGSTAGSMHRVKAPIASHGTWWVGISSFTCVETGGRRKKSTVGWREMIVSENSPERSSNDNKTVQSDELQLHRQWSLAIVMPALTIFFRFVLYFLFPSGLHKHLCFVAFKSF